MREYQCDNRCCANSINMIKLLVSLFDVSNLIWFDEIRFALFANSEFWISYTRFLLNIEIFWNNKITYALKRSWCMTWKNIVIVIFASETFETWKSIVIVTFALEILSFISIHNQSALKIWKSLSWMIQKKHNLMISLSVAFNIKSLISYNSQFSIWWVTVDWMTEKSNSSFSLFSYLFTFEFWNRDVAMMLDEIKSNNRELNRWYIEFRNFLNLLRSIFLITISSFN